MAGRKALNLPIGVRVPEFQLVKFDFSSLISLVAFLGSILVVTKFNGSTALRPWVDVNSSAYVEISNHTIFTRYVNASASTVDSASRFLGSVDPCQHKRFKLPYAGAKVTIDVNGAKYILNVDRPRTFKIDIVSIDGNACTEFTKVATNVIEFVDPASWRSSGYANIGEVVTPFKLVIAGDFTACPIFELTTDQIRVGYLHTCKSSWRMKHG